MVALLVIATLLAPIAALIFADWWRETKRERRRQQAENAMTGGIDRRPMPGWVNKTIKDFKEGKTDGRPDEPA